MNYSQLKNSYYDLVDARQDNNDNIKKLLIKANAENVVIKKDEILFNFENEKYIIDKRLKIFAKKSWHLSQDMI